MTNSVMGAGLLDIKPSPDWKGPRKRVAARQWRREPEPWKAGKNCFLAIFTHKFSYENLQCVICKQMTCRPWHYWLKGKIAWFWPDTECRTQFKDKIRSRRMANC